MESTLLLNASYEPLKVVDWRKAITLWCQGKVEVISVYPREVHSVSLTVNINPRTLTLSVKTANILFLTILDNTKRKPMITN